MRRRFNALQCAEPKIDPKVAIGIPTCPERNLPHTIHTPLLRVNPPGVFKRPCASMTTAHKGSRPAHHRGMAPKGHEVFYVSDIINY